MTEREIQMDILRVCKVAGHDGDFNVVGFYALCDRLKQFGAEEERKACKAKIVAFAKMVAQHERSECAKFLMQGVDLAGLAQDPMLTKYTAELLSGCAEYILARGQA